MAREAAGRPGDGNAFTRFFVRMDGVLAPIFTIPEPDGAVAQDDPVELQERACPVCGHPIFEHTFDEGGGNIILNCPTDERLPERASTTPLNELGMPAHGRRLERFEERQGSNA